MASAHKKIYHSLFAITIIALFIFKWNDLHLAYFWDELGVYSQAADYQFQHVVSLMPSSLPPELSRGHPLLFTFINATAMRIFGEDVFAVHMVCFFISVLLLLAVYLKVSKYFSPLTGIVSVVVLAVQPLFLAQSCLILPEITLALFAFMAICSYYEHKFWLFALFACLAILTKEAAIVLPVVALSYSLLGWVLSRKRPAALGFSAVALTISPYILFGLFLMIQKRQNGWYFFPLHINHVAFSIAGFFRQLHDFTSFLFWRQGRNLSANICLVGAIVALFFGRYTPNRLAHSFSLLLFILGLAVLGFNSVIDLFMERYLTLVLVVFSILTAALVTTILKSRFIAAVFVIVVIITSALNLETGGFHYDADLGYRHSVNSMQQGVTYATDSLPPGELVIGNFPIGFALTFKAGGYLKGKEVNYLWDFDVDHFYLVLSDPGCVLDFDQDKFQLHLERQFDDGYAHVRIYSAKRKQSPPAKTS